MNRATYLDDGAHVLAQRSSAERFHNVVSERVVVVPDSLADASQNAAAVLLHAAEGAILLVDAAGDDLVHQLLQQQHLRLVGVAVAPDLLVQAVEDDVLPQLVEVVGEFVQELDGHLQIRGLEVDERHDLVDGGLVQTGKVAPGHVHGFVQAAAPNQVRHLHQCLLVDALTQQTQGGARPLQHRPRFSVFHDALPDFQQHLLHGLQQLNATAVVGHRAAAAGLLLTEESLVN